MTVPVGAGPAEMVAVTLWELGSVGIEETDQGLRAAFTDLAAATRARDRLAAGAAIETVSDTVGLDSTRGFLGVVHAGPFVIHPPWLAPEPGGHPLSIDPGHAFGSGSHPSTALALGLLAQQDLGGSSVVDLGCGSGVLAIAAAVLGARVWAIDTDPAAIAATEHNVSANRVRDRVRAMVGSIEAIGDEPIDLLMVNVTIDRHEELAPRLTRRPARMIAAGTLAGPQVDRCAAAWRMHIVDEVYEGEWAALVLGP